MHDPRSLFSVPNKGLTLNAILINALQVANMSKGKGEQDRHRKDWNFDFTEISQKRSAIAETTPWRHALPRRAGHVVPSQKTVVPQATPAHP